MEKSKTLNWYISNFKSRSLKVYDKIWIVKWWYEHMKLGYERIRLRYKEMKLIENINGTKVYNNETIYELWSNEILYKIMRFGTN